ncbi:BAG domain-containing protein [Sphaerosporella brunnea]|uniref:BAG domain-containing protein n=1 Tax=Sphaerosporella brunnea TaxID=1250544 RepID=A0A5J5EWS0_9PEZI|nr:BAG domain-containing protein [Sphaerosporella brunnea]
MRRFFGLGGGSPMYTGPIAGDNSADPHRAEDVLMIRHGANEYLFRYPINTIASHALNVGHVRDKCAEITCVPRKGLSLVCAGRQLKEKEDNMTLQTLGIEHGAKIMVMGSAPSPPSQPKAVQLSPAETIEAVREHVVSTLLPLVNEFISGSGYEPADKREDMHRRLAETIMAELLKLDGVESDDSTVRTRRKEVVREIQKMLESLDRALRVSA